jgi:transcriptional regulator with XRE-family HTH domain
MTPIRHIRKHVFNLTQAQFAAVIGVGQASVSRWEDEENTAEPTRAELRAIRDAAVARKLPWDDSWFFDAPSQDNIAPAGEKAA